MDYFTIKELSDLLSVEQSTIRRWINSDKIKSDKNDKGITVIHISYIMDFINCYPKYGFVLFKLQPERFVGVIKYRIECLEEEKQHIEDEIKILKDVLK